MRHERQAKRAVTGEVLGALRSPHTSPACLSHVHRLSRPMPSAFLPPPSSVVLYSFPSALFSAHALCMLFRVQPVPCFISYLSFFGIFLVTMFFPVFPDSNEYRPNNHICQHKQFFSASSNQPTIGLWYRVTPWYPYLYAN